MKNKSPKNAKKNIENLVHNIKCYYVINNNKILDNRTFDGLINYYQKIIEYELQNPNSDIPDELSEEYRRVVKGYSKYNEEK